LGNLQVNNSGILNKGESVFLIREDEITKKNKGCRSPNLRFGPKAANNRKFRLFAAFVIPPKAEWSGTPG